MRVLVTGSRTWTDENLIRWAISFHTRYAPGRDDVTVIHGGAKGADTMAGVAAREMHMHVEVHWADWDTHGKRAGYVRNAEMVAAGADVCLAFIRNSSPGATMCANLAEQAGIPVHRYTEDSP